MRQITIRGVTDELALALEQEKKERGTSLNQAVLDLLRQGLGLTSATHDNGLSKLASTWNKRQFVEFEQALKSIEQIDSELWQ